MGKADKVPIWFQSRALARIRISLTAWHYANGEFLTQAQVVHKVCEMFKAAGETTAADSLSGYMQGGTIISSFADILAIGKIEKLSKLVTGGHVSIHDILMAGAIRDNIPDGSEIALVNTMALLDRDREQVMLTEFKAAFRQTFTTTPPPSDTFYGQNPSRNYDSRDYSKEHRGRTHSKDRATSRHKDFDQGISLHTGPGEAVQLTLQGLGIATTGQVLYSFGPGKTSFLLDSGAQRSCMGECTFVGMGGDLKRLKKSTLLFLGTVLPPRP